MDFRFIITMGKVTLRPKENGIDFRNFLQHKPPATCGNVNGFAFCYPFEKPAQIRLGRAQINGLCGQRSLPSPPYAMTCNFYRLKIACIQPVVKLPACFALTRIGCYICRKISIDIKIVCS